MTHYILTVPVTYKKDDQERTRFARVGAIFENHRRDTGEVFLSIRLDFPVGATDLVAFPPNEAPADDGELPDPA